MSLRNDKTEPPAQEDNRIKKIVKNLVKLILLILVLYFISKETIRNWNEIVSYDWSINIGLLLVSILTHILTFILFSKVWCFIISGFNHQVPLKYGFKLAYIGNLGRYLPGKVWAIFGMAYLAKRLNIKEEESIASWVIAVIFSLPTAFLISFITVILFPEMISDKLQEHLGNSFYYLSACTLAGSLFLILIPNKTLSIFNIFLKLIKRPTINFQVDTMTAFKIYTGYFFSWILFGISFYFFINAITVNIDIPFLACLGAYVFAYQIGF
ncbi:MAG: lysylphosphatidylglycerol synthase domain-containing protein, partial [Candidatus Zixiibacteriota bacterium]